MNLLESTGHINGKRACLECSGLWIGSPALQTEKIISASIFQKSINKTHNGLAAEELALKVNSQVRATRAVLQNASIKIHRASLIPS